MKPLSKLAWTGNMNLDVFLRENCLGSKSLSVTEEKNNMKWLYQKHV